MIIQIPKLVSKIFLRERSQYWLLSFLNFSIFDKKSSPIITHADGNIKYANYQSLDQMTNYLTTNGFADTVALIA